MKSAKQFWRMLAIPAALLGSMSIALAAELNPAAVIYKLPDQIKWSEPDARGVQNAVLVGDPAKPGFYAVMTKWLKGNHFSRPHFHPNDRYITVLQAPGGSDRVRNSILPIRRRCRPEALSRISASRCTGTAPRMRTRCC
jgi:hypothetical protein